MALVVFTGGARSGKSAAAQRLAEERRLDGASVMVAVFGRSGGDSEMSARIERHKAERPAGFATLEVTDPALWLGEVPAEELLLVDCLGTLLGRCMELAWERTGVDALGDAPADELPRGFESEVSLLFDPLVDALASRSGDTIVVTNEVGDGIVPGYASGRLFRDVLGRANRRLVSAADAAYACVAGRLIDLAALPMEARWPED